MPKPLNIKVISEDDDSSTHSCEYDLIKDYNTITENIRPEYREIAAGVKRDLKEREMYFLSKKSK